MKIDRKWLIAGVVLLIAAGVFLYLRSRNNKEETNEDTGAVAPGGSSNLNSVAPELVGGPSGPDVSPTLSLPVNITLNEESKAPKPQVLGTPMQPGARQGTVPTNRQREAAVADANKGPDAGVIPPEENDAMAGSSEAMNDNAY